MASKVPHTIRLNDGSQQPAIAFGTYDVSFIRISILCLNIVICYVQFWAILYLD